MLSPSALHHSRINALIRAKAFCDAIVAMNDLAVQGHEADALQALSVYAGIAPLEVAEIAEILAAEREAAKARDFTQRTLAPFFPGQPAEQPHAANDQTPSPEQPGPCVA